MGQVEVEDVAERLEDVQEALSVGEAVTRIEGWPSVVEIDLDEIASRRGRWVREPGRQAGRTSA